MNLFSYGSEYSHFHGVYNYRVLNDNVIVLDFADIVWDPWNVLRLYQSDYIYDTKFPPLVQAFKIHFKSEAPCTVFCKQDSWTVLIGNERLIIPMSDEKDATLHLYATPYFVESPSVVEEYMQGLTTKSAYENFYPYKNCTLFLDAVDLPKPGASYMNSVSNFPKHPKYRICFLTSETDEKLMTSICSEWKNRRNVFELSFPTEETETIPKFINFQPQQQTLELPERLLIAHGPIYKRQSKKRPHCLIHDILSWYRHARSDRMKDLGLILEWPLVVSFDESHHHRDDSSHRQEFVLLVINGHHPKRVVKVVYPFENFIEYDYVPPLTSHWTPISFVENVLEVPQEFDKICIDSIQIGFVYQGSFFCFGEPVIEARASWQTEYNTKYLLTFVDRSILQKDDKIQVMETYRMDDRFSLHRVQFKELPNHMVWCLSPVNETDAYAIQLRIPHLVKEWTSFFKRHFDEKPVTIRPYAFKLALVLMKHNICFKIKLDNNPNKKESVHLSNDELEIELSEEEAEFMNRARLSFQITPENIKIDNDKLNCSIM